MKTHPSNHEPTSKLTVPLQKLTDNELLVLYVDHQSEAAFVELVSRHRVMVSSVCLSVVSDRNRADDAFQATFLALVRNAHRLRDANSLASWLYRVAHRAAIKTSKMQRQHQTQLESVEPTIDIDPLNHLAAREVVQVLVEELTNIPRRYRESIVLFYFEGLSRAEIAGRMGCSLASVKALLHRGKQLLKRRLVHKGIVPSMVVLGVQAISHIANAADASALVTKTVATCANYGAAASAFPSHLANVSRTGEWTMFTTHAVLSKSLAAAVVIIALATSPLLLMTGNVRAQSSVEAVSYSANETPPPSADITLESSANRTNDDVRLAEMNEPELAAYVNELETRLKAAKLRRDTFVEVADSKKRKANQATGSDGQLEANTQSHLAEADAMEAEADVMSLQRQLAQTQRYLQTARGEGSAIADREATSTPPVSRSEATSSDAIGSEVTSPSDETSPEEPSMSDSGFIDDQPVSTPPPSERALSLADATPSEVTPPSVPDLKQILRADLDSTRLDPEAFEKYSETLEGQQALVEIYLEKVLEIDPKIAAALTPTPASTVNGPNNWIYVNSDGVLRSSATYDPLKFAFTGIHLSDPSGSVQIESELIRDQLRRIQTKLGTLGVSNLSLPQYPEIRFDFEKRFDMPGISDPNIQLLSFSMEIYPNHGK